jgi:hypothetical protein
MNQLGYEIGQSDVTAILMKRLKDDELHRVVRKFYKKIKEVNIIIRRRN